MIDHILMFINIIFQQFYQSITNNKKMCMKYLIILDNLLNLLFYHKVMIILIFKILIL